MKTFWTAIPLIALLLGSCDRQNPYLILAEQTLIVTDADFETHEKEFDFAIADKVVPMKVVWESVEDPSTNCRRIVWYQLLRDGGKRSVVLSRVTTAALACGMEYERVGKGKGPCETLSIACHAETRRGARQHEFNGPIVSILGNGESVLKPY